MTQDEFGIFINKILLYFGREKSLSGQRLDLWYEITKHIPGEALAWVREQIQGDYDTLPTNMPKIIKHYYVGWLEKHPEKKARKYETDISNSDKCPYCYEGLLIAKSVKHGTFYESVSRCGHCHTDGRKGIGKMTVDDIHRENMHHVQPKHKLHLLDKIPF